MKSPDFRDFKPAGEKSGYEPKLYKGGVRWWLMDDAELPQAIISQVSNIIKCDLGRIEAYNSYAKLYGTWVPTFWNGYQISNTGRAQGQLRERLTYNIIQSCIDSLTSNVSENKPKPMFLTQAGSSSLQRRAKKLDLYCYGQFYANDIYKRSPKMFRDSCVYGEGIIHPFAANGCMKYDRVLPYELLTDYLECHNGPENCMTLYRLRNFDRTVLMELCPDKAEDIATMSSTNSFVSSSNPSISDTVTVVEAWRLPAGNVPGRYAMVSENTTLKSKKYNQKFFPFAIHRYNPRLYGFFSQGMAEQLVPSQVEINRTLISIQRSLYLGGTHKIFVKNGSKVIKSHFDNLVGTILEYAGDTAPQYVVPQLVQPEIYAHLNNMISLGYHQPGISEMGATAMKTPGVNSGRAMRTEQNINSQRHATVTSGYHDFFVDLAKITVAVSREAYEAGDEIMSKVPGKRFIQSIKWSEVSLEDDEFHLQIYPVSKLPQDPEGRLETINEMMESQLIKPQVGRRLLDFPDLDAEENLANATQDYLHKILDDIVDSGQYKAPEEDDDLGTAKELVLEYIAQGKLNNLSPERLKLLRLFKTQVDDIVADATQVQVPGGPGAPGLPPMTNVQGQMPQAEPQPAPAMAG